MDFLEAEAIDIIREAALSAKKAVMLYSIGKDSTVMLHLARKAFYPAPIPFPLLHVDTTWKFRDMYAYRARIAETYGVELLVHTNEDGRKANINPFDYGSSYYIDVMKTRALRQALDHHGFDVIFGGARRDEERSRAKERIFSFRSQGHRWDPKSQRPEIWDLYNARIRPGESIRVFPLSNWTELDIWRYIHRENIPIVPLYFAEERPVVRRGDTWIMIDDDRFRFEPGETPQHRMIRFRTLGCYPLTGAVESSARTLADIVNETFQASSSEREGRLIDSDQPSSMEKKKVEGYF
jgi:sulfate adenylyltransferase subunit 2